MCRVGFGGIGLPFTAVALAAALLVTPAGAVEVAVPTVLRVTPHDANAYTQGLVLHQGQFLESTGIYGSSTLRRVEIATGTVLAQRGLPASVFAEGLALVGSELIQLSYRELTAYRWDEPTLSPQGSFSYSGEGWGLCFDGSRLVMSDGSGTLFFRDPATFAMLGQVDVTLDGQPTSMLNELECVGDLVYANVFWGDDIYRIDPASGAVLTRIDAAGLPRPAGGITNGIAFDAVTDHFFLTGKNWDAVYEVTFPFNPYRDDACQPASLPSVADLRVARSGPSGATFSWTPVAVGPATHVNSVATTASLTADGPHRPDRPGGAGVARCEAPAPGAACADLAGLAGGEPLLFFQAYAACGPAGVDEGP